LQQRENRHRWKPRTGLCKVSRDAADCLQLRRQVRKTERRETNMQADIKTASRPICRVNAVRATKLLRQAFSSTAAHTAAPAHCAVCRPVRITQQKFQKQQIRTLFLPDRVPAG